MTEIAQYISAHWVAWMFATIIPTISYIFIKVMAIMVGVRALLRDRIIQAYNHYNDKGFCPIYAHDNIDAMYKAYHNLGGNGTVTELVNKLKELPMEEREE